MKTGILAVVVVLALFGAADAKPVAKRAAAKAPAAAPALKRLHESHPHERPDDTATRVINALAGVLIVGVTAMIARTSREMLEECAANAMLPARG